MSIRVIVSELQPWHGKQIVDRKGVIIRERVIRYVKKFTPFPIGTVRGPFFSDSDRGKNTLVQYCVKGREGWIYFIRPAREEVIAKRFAKERSKQILTNNNLSD